MDNAHEIVQSSLPVFRHNFNRTDKCRSISSLQPIIIRRLIINKLIKIGRWSNLIAWRISFWLFWIYIWREVSRRLWWLAPVDYSRMEGNMGKHRLKYYAHHLLICALWQHNNMQWWCYWKLYWCHTIVRNIKFSNTVHNSANSISLPSQHLWDFSHCLWFCCCTMLYWASKKPFDLALLHVCASEWHLYRTIHLALTCRFYHSSIRYPYLHRNHYPSFKLFPAQHPPQALRASAYNI